MAYYSDERPGDVKHSLADISKAKKLIKYEPEIFIKEGLKRTYDWLNKKIKLCLNYGSGDTFIIAEVGQKSQWKFRTCKKNTLTVFCI